VFHQAASDHDGSIVELAFQTTGHIVCKSLCSVLSSICLKASKWALLRYLFLVSLLR
jgi:hypothetical protein